MSTSEHLQRIKKYLFSLSQSRGHIILVGRSTEERRGVVTSLRHYKTPDKCRVVACCSCAEVIKYVLSSPLQHH